MSDREMLLLWAFLATLYTRIALAMLPLRLARNTLWKLLIVSRTVRAAKRRRPEDIIGACIKAGRYSLVGSTCLSAALVGQALLSKHGHDASLCIGVKRNERGDFAAHAWLEREGRVAIGGPIDVVQSYTRLPSIERMFL
jgi:Transglutaminase-like superfamily